MEKVLKVVFDFDVFHKSWANFMDRVFLSRFVYKTKK